MKNQTDQTSHTDKNRIFGSFCLFDFRFTGAMKELHLIFIISEYLLWDAFVKEVSVPFTPSDIQ